MVLGGDELGYGVPFLKKWGSPCTVLRTPPVTSHVSMKGVSNSSDPSVRDAVHTGIILPDSVLVSGDLFTAGGDTYLVQSVKPDDVSGTLLWFALKCNAMVDVKRFVETLDEETGRIVQEWQTVATTPAWGQIVTARLRQTDPGLLDTARYLFQMPKALGLLVEHRLVYEGRNLKAESIDPIAMGGVVRVQLGDDTRP